MNTVLRTLVFVPAIAVAVLVRTAHAAEAVKSTPQTNEPSIAFHYDNGEITAMIAAYAKTSGRKFIVDPGVRGKASVLLPGEVSLDEGFNILCDVLALNGFSLFEEGDTYIVKSARNAQRDGIPTYTKLPPPRPNRMVTMIFKPKYVKVEELNKRLRILPSKDGEMTPFEPSNSLIVSDYATNLNRIAELIAQIDTPEVAKWKPRAEEKREIPRPRTNGSHTTPPQPPLQE